MISEKRYAPGSIAAQLSVLFEAFPALVSADASVAEKPLPKDADGWFAIPRWEKIAKTYAQALASVLTQLQTASERHDSSSLLREGLFRLEPGWKRLLVSLRRRQRDVDRLSFLAEKQGRYDVLRVPAQFGLRLRGYSAFEARDRLADNEFGLGAFEVASMLLTHIERMRFLPWILCIGDESISPLTDEEENRYDSVPIFATMNACGFGSFPDDIAGVLGASASGFLLE